MQPALVALIAVNLAFTVCVLMLVAFYRLRRLQQKSEERLRVLESLGGGKDVIQFLESDRGRSFLELFGRQSVHPLRIVVATSAFGVILVFVGLAFLGCVWADVWHDGETFLVPGLLCAVGGVGVLVAAAVSSWLNRRWGLIPSEHADA